MSAQPKVNPLPDVEMVRRTQKKTIEILTVYHNALEKIATQRDSETNAHQLRSIAVDAILEVNNIADQSEVQNG